MQNLVLQEGDIVTLRNATLPKGTYVKLQPHTTDFTHISNPRAVLETTLRNFSCLTGAPVIGGRACREAYFAFMCNATGAATYRS